MNHAPRPDRRTRRTLLAWWAAGGVLVLVAALVYWMPKRTAPTHARAQHATDATQAGPTKHVTNPPQARFVAVAGGATPDSNPISLEQNLALAHAVLPGPGVLLFGSGPGGTTVQVLAEDLPRDELLTALGDLFAPRPGRDSRYQAASLPVQSATVTSVRTELSIALARSGPPLLVYISGHGDQGETARDNLVQLWGGDGLSVADLADLHDHARARRELRLVITSCFSGGFADLAFVAADPERGFTKKARCGLFATTWDLESSGCDPNPNRAEQEGYSVHMLNALRARDRDGTSAIDVDYDDDGKVSLLEAHTRATIASRSIDVPTTTSERFLRQHATTIEADDAPTHDAHARQATQAPTLAQPEVDAVIAALGDTLTLRTEAATQARLQALEAELERLDQQVTAAQEDNDDAYNALAMELLARWPVIDDPWHPLFAQTVRVDREAILSALRDSENAQRYAQTHAALQTHDQALQQAQARYAVVARLHRAYETRHLAERLNRQGGKFWSQYQQLLSCERALP